MRRLKDLLLYALIALLFTCLGMYTTSNLVPAMAQSAPNYGTFYFQEASQSTTADATILAAPGAGYQWVVTGVSYNVLVEEADAQVLVEDAAGSPVEIIEFAPETQGANGAFTFGEGIPCSVNSAVQVDFSGSTADCWVSVTAYRVKVPS